MTIVDETATSALGILRRLTRFFRDNDIDLVHTHRYKDSVLGTIAAKLAGVPHVVRTVHGLREPMTGWDRLKFRVYEALDRMTLLCFADLVIAVSMRMADTLRASGYRPTSVTHIHNGVDLEAVVPTRTADAVRRELGIDPRRARHRRRGPVVAGKRARQPASSRPPDSRARPRREGSHRWRRADARRAARSGVEAGYRRRMRVCRCLATMSTI